MNAAFSLLLLSCAAQAVVASPGPGPHSHDRVVCIAAATAAEIAKQVGGRAHEPDICYTYSGPPQGVLNFTDVQWKVPDRMHFKLYCEGAFLQWFQSDGTPVHIGLGVALEFHDCVMLMPPNPPTQDSDSSTYTPIGSVPFARMVAQDSSVQVPCQTVSSVGPQLVRFPGDVVNVGSLASDGQSQAVTYKKATFLPPGFNSASEGPYFDLINTTLWCGSSWQAAAPAVQDAIQSAARLTAEDEMHFRGESHELDDHHGGEHTHGDDHRHAQMGAGIIVAIVGGAMGGALLCCGILAVAYFMVKRSRADSEHGFATASKLSNHDTLFSDAQPVSPLTNSDPHDSLVPLRSFQGQHSAVAQAGGAVALSQLGHPAGAIKASSSDTGENSSSGTNTVALNSQAPVPLSIHDSTSTLAVPMSNWGSASAGSNTGTSDRKQVAGLKGRPSKDVAHAFGSAQSAGSAGSGRSGLSGNGSGGSASGQHVQSMHVAVGIAVAQLQAELQESTSQQKLKVSRVLGKGAFGTVYQGEWRGLDVAIKTVLFQCDTGGRAMEQIASEAAIATNLVHRNIVATYSHDLRPVRTDDDNELDIFKFYLIQEFCNGGSLRAAVDAKCFAPNCGPGRWRRVLRMLMDIATGMCHVHAARICHGDLNPSNVLLKYDAASFPDAQAALMKGVAVGKVTDFGMSMRMQDKTYLSNIKQGTPFYMAPEITKHNRMHKSSDVYAYGVIMWELMAGQAVYMADTAMTSIGTPAPTGKQRLCVRPEFPSLPVFVPLTYTLALKACLAEEPKERPTFTQLLVILRDVAKEMEREVYLDSSGAEIQVTQEWTHDGDSGPSLADDMELDQELQELIHLNGTTRPEAPLSHRLVESDFYTVVSQLNVPSSLADLQAVSARDHVVSESVLHRESASDAGQTHHSAGISRKGT